MEQVLSYRFLASGLENVVKRNVYPLVPTKEIETAPSIGRREYAKVKTPLIYDYTDKYVLVPIILRTESGDEIIIDEAVASINKSKNIVSTQVVGGNGTVKEFISDNDIEINIECAVVALDAEGYIIDEYPEEGIKQLKKILDEKNTIFAYSRFLELFDIDGGTMKIVVKEYNISQKTYSNRQDISIKAVSDYDYTIYSEEN